MDPASWETHVNFVTHGYQDTSKQSYSSSFDPAMTKLGDVEMQALKPQ